MGNFVHLHVHTEYSLLDGAARIEKLVKRCVELGMPAIAITDHGVMYGCVNFFEVCKKHNIKPILGCELYVVDDLKEKVQREHKDHLVLLAKNEEGYRNIGKLDSIAFVDGFYGKPRVDLETIKKYSKDVICLTACLAGRVQQYLMDGMEQKAEDYLLSLKEIFGEDLYVELQDHGIEEQKMVNPKLVELAHRHDIKLVATNDVHYISKSDSEMHDVLLCIQTGAKLSDANRMRFSTNEFYLKSEKEMLEIFPYAPEAITNTLEVADKCNIDLSFHMPLLPAYIPPNGMTPEEYLTDLAWKGIAKRYAEITDEIKERAEYELSTIIRMGFIEYYLIVWDFINYAKQNGIPVGCGRGSGVGSIVAYATGITDVDPLKYQLLFERFLNPERVSMPDFDIDFCCERRGEVIEYVTQKYGSSNVCQIVTFGRLAPKNAIRDTARVYEVPLSMVDKVAKLIPTNPALKISLEKLFKKVNGEEPEIYIPELYQVYEEDEFMHRIIDMAMQIEGMPRNTSMHAAGVIICGKELSSYIPLQRNGENVTTQYTMNECEALGLLKMDFLGLITLTDLKKATDYVLDNHGVEVDFVKLGTNDPEVFKLIGQGDTEGVFQLESGGMKRFMKELKPSSMEDIIAGISLYRPGPMDYIPEYIKGKNNPNKVAYDTEALRDILGVTYGVMVYQEQVMQIVQRLAGYSLGQADIIRRAMSKKKKEEMDFHRKLFVHGGDYEKRDKANVLVGVDHIPGALSKGLDEKVANFLFDKMEKFASYAFNKSHAAAYGTVAYETAYFMRYYPCEFFCSVLNNRISKLDEIKKYTTYSKERGIDVLQPDINESTEFFKATKDGKLRFGLAAIKSVGEAVVHEIIVERKKGPFTDMAEFFDRTAHVINKKMVENLIKAGAFDCFSKTRSQLMAIYDLALTRISKEKKSKVDGQVSFFDSLIEDVHMEIEYPDIPEYPEKERLELEREVLGIYVTGHPLDSYQEELKRLSLNTSMLKNFEASEEEFDAEELEKINNLMKERVKMGGMLKDIKTIMTKSGNIMKRGSLEDVYGSIDVVFFNRVYEANRDLIQDGNIVILTGMLSSQSDGSYQLSVNYIDEISKTEKKEEDKEAVDTQKLYLKIDSEDLLSMAQDVLIGYEGTVSVVVKYKGMPMMIPYTVKVNDAILIELKALLGKDCVVFR